MKLNPKAIIALLLSIPAIGLSITGCGYMLYMFWMIYPGRLSLGRCYWPTIVVVTGCIPLFSAMSLHLFRQLRRAV